jgi:2-dehydro-3-deoxyphosphogalactonate aldolase
MDLTEALACCPLVAILRGVRPDECEAIAAALDHAGFGRKKAEQLKKAVLF